MSKAPKVSVDVDGFELTLKGVRLSYAHLFKPFVSDNDDGDKTKKFSAKFLIPHDAEDAIEAIEEAIEDLKEEKWGKKQPKLKGECLRDGDDEDVDGWEGCMVLSANNSRRPTVLDRDKEPLVEEDGKPYSGCYVNAIVRLWAQDNKWGKRINASLEAVQFFKDGEAFGAPPVDTDEKFESYDEDDEEDEGGRSSRRSKKSRRSRDEDDEDEKPRRRSRRGRQDDEDDEDDDEEDEAPRRRRRRGR